MNRPLRTGLLSLLRKRMVIRAGSKTPAGRSHPIGTRATTQHVTCYRVSKTKLGRGVANCLLEPLGTVTPHRAIREGYDNCRGAHVDMLADAITITAFFFVALLGQCLLKVFVACIMGRQWRTRHSSPHSLSRMNILSLLTWSGLNLIYGLSRISGDCDWLYPAKKSHARRIRKQCQVHKRWIPG